MVHIILIHCMLFLCYNFIEDVIQTDKKTIEQQSYGKLILLNLYMIT